MLDIALSLAVTTSNCCTPDDIWDGRCSGNKPRCDLRGGLPDNGWRGTGRGTDGQKTDRTQDEVDYIRLINGTGKALSALPDFCCMATQGCIDTGDCINLLPVAESQFFQGAALIAEWDGQGTVKTEGDDPDMDQNDGVPPNSVGSGTRFALMLLSMGYTA